MKRIAVAMLSLALVACGTGEEHKAAAPAAVL
jgi:hypothetical protein